MNQVGHLWLWNQRPNSWRLLQWTPPVNLRRGETQTIFRLPRLQWDPKSNVNEQQRHRFKFRRRGHVVKRPQRAENDRSKATNVTTILKCCNISNFLKKSPQNVLKIGNNEPLSSLNFNYFEIFFFRFFNELFK